MDVAKQRVMQLRASGGTSWRADELTAEEPLEIRVDSVPLSVTMRTPGHDLELAAGFLITEGLVTGAGEIVSMRTCPQAGAVAGPLNVVEVTLQPSASRPRSARHFYVTSSCGICGKASIDQVRTICSHPVREDPLRVSPELLLSFPERLRQAQPGFARTGGLHAAGLFDGDGGLVCVREDVGRHNAFDKVIGWAATRGLLPLRSHIILASGRASFELTQKALMAGIPLLAAVSAPSDLAVALARESGMTLVGFLRGDRMNVYSGHHRLAISPG
ncbi:MAG TPA: formate dehydrogenase accessory sulfurtransferase FdhD [Candidatus Binatia bacterium]|nr:formate dehydrogenase accessory sulfurtransferase FdhD [Candidatus Binatia bacterium]